MNAKDRSEETHGRLLAAAERLALREGAARLTLDEVAREAGVSKGGLLYHFPSKSALISEMVEHLAMERFEREVEQRSRGKECGDWVRAYVEATFDPADEQRNAAVRSGLFAAVANDPSLLEPMRRRYEELQKRVESDGVDPAAATIARLASDGLWFLELFDIPAVEGRLRERVFQRLISLAGED